MAMVNVRVLTLLNRLVNEQALSAERASFLARQYRQDKDPVELVTAIYEDFNPEKVSELSDICNKIMAEGTAEGGNRNG